MLSIEALRQIGGVDRDQIERRIRILFDKWAQGDIEAMVAYLAPDVAFPSNGFWTNISPQFAAAIRSRNDCAPAMARSKISCRCFMRS